MNCSRHNDRPAVGQCQHCGAGLCGECYNYSGGVCYNCFREIVADDNRRLRKMWMGFILWGLIFGILFGMLLGSTTSSVDPSYGALSGIGMGFYAFMGGASFGVALQINKGTRITFGQGLVMAVIALLIGPIMFIIRLIQLIKFIKDVKDEKRSLEQYPRY